MKLHIIGQSIRLEELSLEHFPYIVQWRNDPENKKFLNQDFILTEELQAKWYKETYLPDKAQFVFIIVDNNSNKPVGTISLYRIDQDKRQAVAGRLILGDKSFQDSFYTLEGCIMMEKFGFEVLGLKSTYIHIVNENRKVISYNTKLGYVENTKQIQYPEFLRNGDQVLKEYILTYDKFKETEQKLRTLIQIAKKNMNF